MGIRKIETFIRENLIHSRKVGNGSKTGCLFLGREDSYIKAAALIEKSVFLSAPVFVQCSHDVSNDIRLDGIETVVFDTGAFTYDYILEWIYCLYSSGRRITVGFYSPDTGRLITDIEVL